MQTVLELPVLIGLLGLLNAIPLQTKGLVVLLLVVVVLAKVTLMARLMGAQSSHVLGGFCHTKTHSS